MGLVKAICFLLALFYLILCIQAQQHCSLSHSFGHQCNGPEGDIWMGPFIFGIVGIPLVIISIIITIVDGIRLIAKARDTNENRSDSNN